MLTREELKQIEDIVRTPLAGLTPLGVTVGNTTTEVLEANADRKAAIFINDSDETLYLAVGQNAVMNRGERLNAQGGSFVMSPKLLSLEAVNGICSSGGKICTVQEFEAA